MTSGRIVTAALAAAVATWLGAILQVVPGLAAAAVDGVPDAPARLVETGLYADLATRRLAGGIEAYSPQYPLWSDGLTKRRWMALPAGATIDTSDPYAWNFPVGTKLWKEFALGDRRIETRFYWRATASRWVGATYVWNEAGTEAILAPADGVPGVVEVAPGKRHSVPSQADCVACHGPATQSRVLGLNALQLSTDRDPDALHGETLTSGMTTVATLQAAGRFGPTRPAFVDSPARIVARGAGSRSVLGYLAANCGMCHDGSAEIAGFDASLAARDIVADADAAIARLVERPSRWHAPGVADADSVLVRPGSAASSVIYLRMRSRSPSSQMAPLGSVVPDAAAVAAVGRWIDETLAPSH